MVEFGRVEDAHLLQDVAMHTIGFFAERSEHASWDEDLVKKLSEPHLNLIRVERSGDSRHTHLDLSPRHQGVERLDILRGVHQMRLHRTDEGLERPVGCAATLELLEYRGDRVEHEPRERRSRRIVEVAPLMGELWEQRHTERVPGLYVDAPRKAEPPGGMEPAWAGFLESLKQRGLHGVELLISDAHTGLKAARRTVMTGVPWQRCRVHFMRNMLAYVPKKAKGFVSATLKAVFETESYEQAKEMVKQAVKVLEADYPMVAELLEGAQEDVLAYKHFPEAHHRQLHSTNPL